MKPHQMIFLAVFILLLGSGKPAYSLSNEPDNLFREKVALEDLIHYALQNNPSIRATKEAWKATVENFRVMTGYPDPQLMVSYYPEPIETRLGPQDWNVNLSQTIPFPGKLSKAGEVVEAETRIAKLRLDKTTREVLKSIKQSYHELHYIREAKRIAGENLKLLNHLRKVGETAYVVDKATLLDMVKAQSQLGQLQYDIILLKDLEQTEITRMNTILNRLPGAEIGQLHYLPFQPVTYGLDELYQLAEENQEDILIAQNQIEKGEVKVELARVRNLPDFKLGLFYGSIGTPDVPQPPPDAGRDSVGVQVGVTLPLWSGKNKGRVARAYAEMQTAKEEKEIQVNQVRMNIRSLYFRLENAKRLTELYRHELLPQAAKAMEMAEVWFRNGESSFSDFVEAQAVWYNFQLTFERASADYGKNLASIEQLVGQSIIVRNDRSSSKLREGEK
ncbi:TolC family protein [Thermodesulfobacteriota bacterium]